MKFSERYHGSEGDAVFYTAMKILKDDLYRNLDFMKEHGLNYFPVPVGEEASGKLTGGLIAVNMSEDEVQRYVSLLNEIDEKVSIFEDGFKDVLKKYLSEKYHDGARIIVDNMLYGYGIIDGVSDGAKRSAEKLLHKKIDSLDEGVVRAFLGEEYSGREIGSKTFFALSTALATGKHVVVLSQTVRGQGDYDVFRDGKMVSPVGSGTAVLFGERGVERSCYLEIRDDVDECDAVAVVSGDGGVVYKIAMVEKDYVFDEGKRRVIPVAERIINLNEFV